MAGFGSKKNQHVVYAMFLAPALIIYITFLIGPVLSSFYYSLTDWNGFTQTISFIGLDNFRKMLDDAILGKALRNTFQFTFWVVVVQNVLAVPLAVFLDLGIRSKNGLKAIFFAPAVLSPLVVGYTWMNIYEPANGLLNATLRALGLEHLQQTWLGDPKYALYSIVVMVVWQFTGYSMVIYLANLQTIPGDLYEAASMDGAGAFRKFWSVTFPLLAPSVTINMILSTIGTLKAFDIVYVTTKGGPYYATETLSTLLFSTAFSKNQFGYGTSIGVLMFVIVFIITLIQIAILRRRELTA